MIDYRDLQKRMREINDFNQKDKKIYNVYNLYSFIFLIFSNFYIEDDTRVLRFLSKSISEFHNLDLFVYYLTRKSEFL